LADQDAGRGQNREFREDPRAQRGKSRHRRNVATEEVGNTAAFCAAVSHGITGEVVYVDAGFNTVAFAAME
jgi:enoyl-[acyl-carrier-protein] reductase (NADH)